MNNERTPTVSDIVVNVDHTDFVGSMQRAKAVYDRWSVVICEGLIDANREFQSVLKARDVYVAQQFVRWQQDSLEAGHHGDIKPPQTVMDLERLGHTYAAKVYDFMNFHPTLYGLAGHPLLSKMSDFLIHGELTQAAICNGFQLRMDMPSDNEELLNWHRDIDYFPTFSPHGLVTWFPLEDIKADMGGVNMALGQFQMKDFDPVFWDKQRPGTSRTSRRAEVRVEDLKQPTVPVVIKAGDCAFFSMTTPHCSLPNHSNDIRWCFQIRWYTANDPVYWTQTRGAMSSSKM